MLKLRFKILSGFVILSLMLFIAGLWSIYEFSSIGVSVQNILDDNYKSIQAAKSMKEALEREDSGILMLLLGNREQGHSILTSADSLFNKKFEMAYNNITIENEHEHLELIKDRYAAYRKVWKKPLEEFGKEGGLDWYFKKVHPLFLSVNESVDDLINLNDQVMYQTASSLKTRSERAIMPGIIAIISALIFTFIFNYMVNYYMIGPIVRITKATNLFKEKRVPFNVKIETRDEIHDLAQSIDGLCSSVKNKENRK